MIENFPNSPITEALIEIKVEQSSPFELSALENCYEILKDKYPIKKTRRVWEGQIEFKEGLAPVSTPSRNNIDGYQFWSEDQKQVTQFRVDGFVFSRLKPYKDWDQMYGETMRLWETYITKVKPLAITRLAVRYINLIEIPSAKFELSDYFSSPPKLPDSIQEQIAHFMTRFVINIESINSRAVITTTVAPQTKPDVTGIIFDIDIFRENIHLNINDQNLSETLHSFRVAAYRIFSETLTNRTKELFK